MSKYGESRGIKVNKSHAAAYATISYQTAWLKHHYPAEYMCSVMSRSKFEDLPKLIANCRSNGLRILPPDINNSANDFTNKERDILFGFSNIKGVGSAGSFIIAERTNGAFVSVKEFVTRMLSGSNSAGYNKAKMESLIKSGAFDAFCGGNRASILSTIEEFSATTKSMLEKQAKVAERRAAYEEMQSNGASEAELKKAERSIKSAEKSLAAVSDVYAQHAFVAIEENHDAKLRAEFELLGFYLSGNPFDNYSDAAKRVKGRYTIADALDIPDKKKIRVCGIMRNIEFKQRKKDGRTFVIFKLFDETSEIEAKCFVNKYETYRSLVMEGNAVSIEGFISTDKRTMDDGEEIDMGKSISVDTMELLERNNNERIIITALSVVDYAEHEAEIMKYRSPTGHPAYFTDEMDRIPRKLKFLVSRDILDANIPGLSISYSKTTV